MKWFKITLFVLWLANIIILCANHYLAFVFRFNLVFILLLLLFEILIYISGIYIVYDGQLPTKGLCV